MIESDSAPQCSPPLQVIMPGYCVQGTVGHKILNGAKKIDFENRTSVEVNLSVEVRNICTDTLHLYLSFPPLPSCISSILCLKLFLIHPFNLAYRSATSNVNAFITFTFELCSKSHSFKAWWSENYIEK